MPEAVIGRLGEGGSRPGTRQDRRKKYRSNAVQAHELNSQIVCDEAPYLAQM
jgi:hypothetical protein